MVINNFIHGLFFSPRGVLTSSFLVYLIDIILVFIKTLYQKNGIVHRIDNSIFEQF